GDGVVGGVDAVDTVRPVPADDIERSWLGTADRVALRAMQEETCVAVRHGGLAGRVRTDQILEHGTGGALRELDAILSVAADHICVDNGAPADLIAAGASVDHHSVPVGSRRGAICVDAYEVAR